jgi:hypothetical protein
MYEKLDKLNEWMQSEFASKGEVQSSDLIKKMNELDIHLSEVELHTPYYPVLGLDPPRYTLPNCRDYYFTWKAFNKRCPCCGRAY